MVVLQFIDSDVGIVAELVLNGDFHILEAILLGMGRSGPESVHDGSQVTFISEPLIIQVERVELKKCNNY